MVIKVYVSRCSGNMEIKKCQEQIIQLLQGNGIVFEECDVSDPSCEEDKKFMWANSDPKDGQQIPLPPQIFSDEEYLGDFDAFHEANECDELYEFLRISPPKNKSEAIVSFSEDQLSDHINGMVDHYGELCGAQGTSSSSAENEELTDDVTI